MAKHTFTLDNDDSFELNTNNNYNLNLNENTSSNFIITTGSNNVLNNGSTVELNTDTNIYGLELIESFSPGPPPEGPDYESLKNKPQINSITLQGNITLQQLGLRSILYGTTEEWNSQNNLIAEEGTVYIYSDYQTTIIDGVEKTVPGIKIGDGKAYLIDTPFITQAMQQALFQHTTNLDIHTNLVEKNFWNQKITSFMDNKDSENLVLSYV